MASTEDVRIGFFQHKSFYESAYSFSGKEDVCFSLIRSLQKSLSGQRRRKLGEIGNLELFSSPPKRFVRESPVKKPLRDVEKRDLINSLPDELLVEIFRFIPAPADRYSCASTCLRWLMLQSHMSAKAIKGGDEVKSLGSGDELKRSLEGKRATDVKLALTALGTQGRGGLGKLIIKGGPRQNPAKAVSNLGLSSVGICCVNLKILSIWDCPGVGDAGFSWIGRGCSQLQALNVLNCPGFGDTGLRAIAAGCSSLTSLSLENCSRVGDAGLEAVAKHCAQLTCLSVVGCQKVSDSGVVSVVSSCKQLRAVRIEKVGIRDAGLRAIGEQGESIQKLKLAQLDLVTADGFFLLGNNSNMSQLKQLHISACRGFSDKLLLNLGKTSKVLKSLTISGCGAVNGSSLLALMNDCGSLESLQLERCTLQCSSEASVGGGALKALGLVNCAGGKSHFLASVAGAGGSLTELDLTGETSLSDAMLVALVAGCGASLSRLNISGCVRITDAGIGEVVKLCPALSSLTLDGCQSVSDEALRHISGGSQALQELIISNCFRVSDSGVSALVSTRGSQLKTLSLAGCSITELSLGWIEAGCQALEALNLKGCRGVDRDEAEALESRLWKCLVCY